MIYLLGGQGEKLDIVTYFDGRTQGMNFRLRKLFAKKNTLIL
jgi:hypothetical protein